MSEHAILAPSSAARWVQCPASAKLALLFPETQDSPKALEGTLAHAVCVAVLQGSPVPAGATDEMLEGADLYVDAIHARTSVSGGMIESKVFCKHIHPENWGTPDFWSINHETRILDVVNYKFGHRHVDAFENWQMIDYAAGCESVAGVGKVDLFRLTVVQPRNYCKGGPVRTWEIKTDDLRAYWVELAMKAQAAMEPTAPTIAGPECRDCPARHACSTLQNAAYAACDWIGVNTPFELGAGALGRELRTMQDAAGLLAARIGGLENEVLGKIKSGVSIPGWMTEQGQGREKWAKPVSEIIALGQMMGVDVAKPGVLTCKQAIKAGIPAEVVQSYTETPIGEVKLVQSNLRKIFGA